MGGWFISPPSIEGYLTVSHRFKLVLSILFAAIIVALRMDSRVQSWAGEVA